jgi:hypothetical protein
MNTEERLANLEALLPLVERELAHVKRHNRRLLIAVGLAAGVFGLVWIGAAAGCKGQAPGGGVATVIRAAQFVLEDENGKTRATLALTNDGPVLCLTDEKGNPRAVLTAFRVGPRLSLFDEKGKDCARLGANKDGPVLALTDEKGNPRAVLGVNKYGPALGLYDADGRVRAGLNALQAGPGLDLLDENGKVRASLGTGSATTTDGTKITYPESSIRLFNAEAKVIWLAP